MSAYVVNVVTNQAEIVVCELYASYSLASSRALTLARACAVNNPTWVNPNAPEEVLEDGSIRWTFLETSKFLVAVHFKHVKNYLPTSNQYENLKNTSNFIKYGDQLKSSPITVSDGYQSPVIPPVVQLVPDNFYESTLPGGFDHKGKPLTMKDVVDDPFNVASYVNLSENQQWAIVTARIRKRPGFRMFSITMGSLSQIAALAELEKKSSIGLEIRDEEIDKLETLLTGLMLDAQNL